MNLLRRVGTVGVLAAWALTGGGVQQAVGSSTTSAPSAVLQAAWYWHHQASAVPQAAVSASMVPEPSNVPSGDVAVASTDGQGTPSKLAYLAFDLSQVPPTATVSAFTVTLTVDSAATNVAPQAPALVAALSLRSFLNNTAKDSGDTTTAPPVASGPPVAGVYTKVGSVETYTFQVPQFAGRWLTDVNDGLAIEPKAAAGSPFQLSFAAAKVRATVTYTPAAVVSGTGAGTTGGSTAVPPAGAAPSAPTPRQASAPLLPQIPSALSALPPAGPTGTGGSLPAPLVQAPAVAAGVPAPAVAAGAPAAAVAGGTLTAALHPGHVGGGPTLALLAVLVLGLLLLAVLSLGLGAPPTVAAASERTSRLTRVLDGRGRSGAGAGLTGLRPLESARRAADPRTA